MSTLSPAAKAQLADSQNARRAIEKDVAVHQGRLSKFREQAMAVKTNQEYHAIQHEIAFAESQVKTLEDKILEHMLEADDLVASAALGGVQRPVRRLDQLRGSQRVLGTRRHADADSQTP